MWKLKIGAILALLIGPFIIVMNFLEISEKTKIDKEGVATEAFVEQATEKKGRKGRVNREVELAYIVEGAKEPVHKKMDVSKEIFDRLTEENRTLPVKYLKADPTKLIIVGEPKGQPALYAVGAAIFLFGIGGIWWFFIRRPHGV